jgi:hypothetical protein
MAHIERDTVDMIRTAAIPKNISPAIGSFVHNPLAHFPPPFAFSLVDVRFLDFMLAFLVSSAHREFFLRAALRGVHATYLAAKLHEVVIGPPKPNPLVAKTQNVQRTGFSVFCFVITKIFTRGKFNAHRHSSTLQAL